jgi:hypothetical protein
MRVVLVVVLVAVLVQVNGREQTLGAVRLNGAL